MNEREKEEVILSVAKALFYSVIDKLPENQQIAFDELEQQYKAYYKKLAKEAIILSPPFVWDYFTKD